LSYTGNPPQGGLLFILKPSGSHYPSGWLTCHGLPVIILLNISVVGRGSTLKILSLFYTPLLKGPSLETRIKWAFFENFITFALFLNRGRKAGFPYKYGI
jgi:hypothetical protein